MCLVGRGFLIWVLGGVALARVVLPAGGGGEGVRFEGIHVWGGGGRQGFLVGLGW